MCNRSPEKSVLFHRGVNLILCIMLDLNNSTKSGFDKEKLEALYRLYRDRMFQFAMSIVKDRNDAEDAVHDTFIKIARNIQSIDAPESKASLYYVLTAVKNTSFSILRNKKKNKEHLTDLEKTEIRDSSFTEQLEIQQEYERVVQAIIELDDIYNDVLYLHFVCENDIRTVADLLGLKRSTVKQRLVRGKKLLLETLKQEKEDK